MKTEILLLEEIIRYCDNIMQHITDYGDDEEIFYEEIGFQQSCSFCLFQIGECVKNIPSSLKESYPEVDWRGISGLRDIIGHSYGDINLKRVWHTISKEVPVLKRECEIILDQIK